MPSGATFWAQAEEVLHWAAGVPAVVTHVVAVEAFKTAVAEACYVVLPDAHFVVQVQVVGATLG